MIHLHAFLGIMNYKLNMWMNIKWIISNELMIKQNFEPYQKFLKTNTNQEPMGDNHYFVILPSIYSFYC